MSGGRYRTPRLRPIRDKMVQRSLDARGPDGDEVNTQWLYKCNSDDSARFVLGTVGHNPLVCVGVNPSTARPGALDQTVSKVEGFALRNGYDSWVMLNLYPQRSTDPEGMHEQHEPSLKFENEQHIREFIDGRPLTLLGAWGELITTRAYLPRLLEDIVADLSTCRWLSIGQPINGGHPRHPSRPAYALPLNSFDMDSYLGRLALRRAP